MPHSNEFLSKIISSNAYRSIRAEQEIVDCIKTYKWNASHSPFYCDPVTGKLREIDAVAVQLWEKGRGEKRISASLKLYIEVKSAMDSHILISGSASTSKQLDNFWIYYNDKAMEAMTESLRRSGFDGGKINNFIEKFETLSFPKELMKTAPLKVNAFNVVDSFSAFRESTTKIEKELDNSVLWRALSALRSAIEADKNHDIENMLSDLEFGVEMANRFSDNPIDSGLDSINPRVNNLKLFHPVVVIDSTLWSVVQDQPKQLKWFRFSQLSSDGEIEWWGDVVARSSFDEYMHDLTMHYENKFKDARAKRSN